MGKTISFTPRMGECIKRANSLAEDGGQSYVGTEHMLLSFLRDPDSIAAQAIQRAGATEKVTEILMEVLNSPGYNQDQ